MGRIPKHFLFLLAVTLLVGTHASAFQSGGRSLIVIDHATGAVLAEKNADDALPPASMSKLMTLNMAFEALAAGRLTLDLKLPVSERAVAYKGSSMFLQSKERVSVEDLIRGVIVLSGNDASVVLAEALSPDGTELGFARLMETRASELGMTNSYFANSNGWPDPYHRMSTRDLAFLASRLIRDFPVYYRYFSEHEFLFDNRVPDNRFNRNPLLTLGIGADGLKTGYTRDAGYGIVGSAIRGDRRVVFVVNGLDSVNRRTAEAEQIVNWYFIHFSERQLFGAGEEIAEAPLWMGAESTVTATVGNDAVVLVPSSSKGGISAKAVFQQQLEAPVSKDQRIGELIVTVDGLSVDYVFPLVANEAVERAGFFGKLLVAGKTLFTRLIVKELLGG